MKPDDSYLKPHTIVKIRPNLEKGKCGNNFVTSRMLEYKGQITSILDAVKTEDGYLYSISADNGTFWWTKEMLEDESYPLIMLLANELGLTYNEILSDYKNSTGKSELDVITEEELEHYIKTKYGKFLF